jgi:hypothetical protein
MLTAENDVINERTKIIEQKNRRKYCGLVQKKKEEWKVEKEARQIATKRRTLTISQTK